MDVLSISQAAERTGFSPSTLRFYEQAGLVAPTRTLSGYRCYGDEHLDALAFIGRAKRLGLSLDDITDLLGLLGEDRCGPVQGRLRELIATRLADARRQMTDLSTFVVELEQATADLGHHTPDGPCDDSCGCRSDAPRPASSPVSPTTKRKVPATPLPIVCSLSRADLTHRQQEWGAFMSTATVTESTEAGATVLFPPSIDVGALARLVAAECDCCNFFTFAITLDGTGVSLEVSAPPDARPMIDLLIGVSK